MGAVRTWVVVGLALAIVAVGGGGLWLHGRQGEAARFCKAALAGGEVDGLAVALQDQGDPGPDPCDEGETDDSPNDVFGDRGDRGTLVLGFDCAVRDREGEVVATTTPNRSDGTCGIDG